MGVNVVFFCLIQDEHKPESFEDPTNDPPVVVFHLLGNSEIKSADTNFSLQISSAV